MIPEITLSAWVLRVTAYALLTLKIMSGLAQFVFNLFVIVALGGYLYQMFTESGEEDHKPSAVTSRKQANA
jgi:flagellar biosynthesis component FlhA